MPQPVSGNKDFWLWTLTDKASDYALLFSMYILYPAILIVVCVDVVGRNFFAAPLSWAIEGSGLFLIGGIFLAAPRVELDRGHILLDILYATTPARIKAHLRHTDPFCRHALDGRGHLAQFH